MDDDAQRQTAIRLAAFLRDRDIWIKCMPRVTCPGEPDAVPNLGGGSETAAVEGILHRVLEELVGERVELSWMGSWWCRGETPATWAWPTLGSYATRIEAIVAALLAL